MKNKDKQSMKSVFAALKKNITDEKGGNRTITRCM